MTNDIASIVERFWSAWHVQDKVAAMRCFADNIEMGIHIPQETLPFGGITVGKPSISDRMQTVIDQFETLQYEGTMVAVAGATVRGQVAYCFRHRMTGEVIEGVARHVVEVEDGLIVRLHEYHDAERIKAFMRLVSYKAANRCLA